MRTLVANGTLVTASDVFPGDILIEDERIAAIGRGFDVPVDRRIDARRRLVMPGAVDAHTHLALPVGDAVSSDDFATGTAAAACGGTTTIIDFPTQQRGGSLRDALNAWHAKAEGAAAVDYGFHMIVADWSPAVSREMEEVVQEGITSFKVFMAYPDRLMLDDGALLELMQRARSLGALTMVHAENGAVIEVLVRQALAQGHTAPRFHAATRPGVTEVEAVRRAVVLAELADASLYVVHVSTAGAADAIADARARGVAVQGETCPHYLVLTEEAYDAPGSDGAKFVMSPPLRSAADQARLWRALAAGELQVVSTDHCPFWLADKGRGRSDFSRIPNGAPGIETRLPLVWDAGVRGGWLTPSRFVDLVASAPARLFGLYPRKGALVPGADADIVIFDPDATRTISVATHHMRVDYSPYEGRVVMGAVDTVLLRGRPVVEEGRFVGTPGAGRFLMRERT
jgi:dihydropyrimidinase